MSESITTAGKDIPNIPIIPEQISTNKNDFVFKIGLIGDSAVGKTSLLSRFLEEKFNTEEIPTTAVDFKKKSATIDNKNMRTWFLDVEYKHRWTRVNCIYPHVCGVIIVYDITRYPTFETAQLLVDEFKRFGDKDTVILLVGNKKDLKTFRAVETEDAETYAHKNEILFIEASALDMTNAEKVFQSVLTDIYYKIRSNEELKLPPIFPGKKFRS